MTAIAVPKYDVYPSSINKHGVVVGTYQTKGNSSTYGGFIWTP